MEKKYVCECGRIFDKANSFNGHKSHCPVHLSITGKLELHKQLDKERGKKAGKTLVKHTIDKKQKELEEWLSSKSVCEKCGKVMTERFGSGRFCSKACASSRKLSDEAIKKIGESNKKNVGDNNLKHIISMNYYNVSPKYCKICGEIIPYDKRHRKTCSDVCSKKLISLKSSKSAERLGGNNNINGVRGTAKYGTYKGFHCDSSFELAFVIYCLEHNILIKRNTNGFNYVFEGKTKKYYPDFIVNNTYIEIKNYWTPVVQAKFDYFPKDLNYKILYKDDLKICIEYCIMQYGKDYTRMYDSAHPSWMNK